MRNISFIFNQLLYRRHSYLRNRPWKRVDTVECRYNTAQEHVYNTAVTMKEYKTGIALTRDTSYLFLTGELWGVYCDNLGENSPRYTDTALYIKAVF